MLTKPLNSLFTKGLYVFCLLILSLAMQTGALGQGAGRLSLQDTFGRGGYQTSRNRVTWTQDLRYLKAAKGGLTDPENGRKVEKDAVGKRVNPKVARPARPKMNKGELGARVNRAGTHVGFVQGFNLFVRPPEDAEAPVTAVSTDGSEELLYGRLDWVYQEEVYGRGKWNGMWWSGDSRHLAFLRIDESAVHEFTVVDHIPYRLKVETTNYPKAGDPNPVATLGVFNVKTKKTVYMDLSHWNATDLLIVRVGWTPDSRSVVFQIQNRIQNTLDLCVGDPRTGKVKILIHEASPNGWVNVLEMPRWLDDGTFLWWSERTGYKHLYHYKASGKLLNAVTAGNWVVRTIIRVDEAAGKLWFHGNRDGSTGQRCFSVGLNGKGLTDLTPTRGTHRVTLNHDGSYLVDSWSSCSDPGGIDLRDGAGNLVRQLARNTFSHSHQYSPRKLVVIKARDGFELDATVLLPEGRAPAAGFPVMIDTYSGPDAPSVRDSFSVSTWHQFLAQKQIAILQVNVRSASGKGQVTTETCYKQFGVQELRDLEDALVWLGKNESVNLGKVGIQGWSYGGFMSAYALTHSKAFALGLAGAGVYDWRDYDTIYTERYMSTPELNKSGYKVSSCVAAAKDLHGHLQIVHGSMDDNVHMQNTMQFIDALQKAGKDFELMIYPQARHGLKRHQYPHLRRFQWAAIQKVLLGRAN